MSDLLNCDCCKKEYDFGKYASGSCSTCELKNLCYDCIWAHPGKHEGKVCQTICITNPQWVCNLVKTLEKNEKL